MKRFFFYAYLYTMTMFLVVYFIISPLYIKAVSEHRGQQLSRYWQNFIGGFMHVLEKDLQRTPVAQWSAAVKEMQPHFGFPIEALSLASPELSDPERSALNDGELVIKESFKRFYYPLSGSGMVLSMGPIAEFQFFDVAVNLLFCFIIAIVFSIFTLLWALPIAKNLRRISNAAAAFGKGELGARVMVTARSSLSPLANGFNRMADRIQELISSHKELTHAVSHEFRTPLARLRFGMELMTSAENSFQREQHLEGMRRDVDELDSLVSELLRYANFDRKNFRPPMETLELGPWLMRLASEQSNEAIGRQIDCRIGHTECNTIALVSPRFLERAIRNLLQNAARYTHERIVVALENTGHQWMIHVDDDGPGIPPADRQRIFEPFIRLKTNSDSKHDGYGLGLAIVRRVAEWHNGCVVVGQAPIGGARFTISWPNQPLP